MMKKLITLITILSYILSHSQLELYNEGGSGLTFYVGQNHTVQAEGDVTNAAGATIEFENGGTPDFRLKGNFVNSTTGTYTLGTEKVRFNGSSLQTADFGGDDVYGIYTDNSSNIQIDRNVTVTGDLEFGTGDIISTTSSHITIETTGTVTGADDDSHNFGPIAKNFNSTSEFTFPIGDGTSYRASSFTPDEATAVTMRSMYYGSKFPLNWRYNSPIYKISQLEYWDMYRTSGTTDGTVKLTWDANSDVGDYLDLVVGYYAPWWITAGGNGHTGNNTAGTVSSNASWSIYDTYFTLATTTSDNPLPIELLSFNATQVGEFVELNWETAAEINSDYFSLMIYTDVKNFEEIAQLKAAGFSNDVLEYIKNDYSPSEGLNYYKLVNYDLDGTFQESEIQMVYFSGNQAEKLSLSIYPNPISSEASFDFFAKEEGQYKLNIYEITGKIVYSSNIMAPEGNNTFTLNMDTYTTGKYIVQIISPSQEIITTSIKKK